MGFLDDAIGRAQQLADAALSPTVADPTPLGLNPTLAATNAGPGDAQPREPIKKSAVFDNNGVATITLDPVEPNTTWLLDYVVVVTTSTNQTLATLYENAVSPANVIDGTGKGNRGVAWYQPPRRLGGTLQLIVQWTGGTPGATANLRLEYRVEAAP